MAFSGSLRQLRVPSNVSVEVIPRHLIEPPSGHESGCSTYVSAQSAVNALRMASVAWVRIGGTLDVVEVGRVSRAERFPTVGGRDDVIVERVGLDFGEEVVVVGKTVQENADAGEVFGESGIVEVDVLEEFHAFFLETFGVQKALEIRVEEVSDFICN